MTIVSGLRNKPGETPEPHGYIESTWLSCVKPWEHAVGEPERGHHRRPVGREAHRPGDAAAVARAHDLAGGRAPGVAHAHAVAAAGGQPARGVPEAVRTGRHGGGTRSDPRRDRQHPGSREGAGRPAADQPRRARPRHRERLPGLGARDRAPGADGVEAGRLEPGRAGRAGGRAQRHHRALQADVRPDGAGVPGGHHARSSRSRWTARRACGPTRTSASPRRSTRSRTTATARTRWRSWCRSSAITPRCSRSSWSGCRRRRRRAAACWITPPSSTAAT